MKRRPTQVVATRIVREHLADMGGPELGWTFDASYRRLRAAIEQALLEERAAARRQRG
jgi:hypothetical protein